MQCKNKIEIVDLNLPLTICLIHCDLSISVPSIPEKLDNTLKDSKTESWDDEFYSVSGSSKHQLVS